MVTIALSILSMSRCPRSKSFKTSSSKAKFSLPLLLFSSSFFLSSASLAVNTSANFRKTTDLCAVFLIYTGSIPNSRNFISSEPDLWFTPSRRAASAPQIRSPDSVCIPSPQCHIEEAIRATGRPAGRPYNSPVAIRFTRRTYFSLTPRRAQIAEVPSPAWWRSRTS